MQNDAKVIVLQWTGGQYYDFGCQTWYLSNPKENPFATQSLELSEKLAQSDPYIISNDDTLIYGQDFVQNGINVMNKYKDFGCISGAVVNGDQYKFDGPELTEIHAVGGLVFLRKNLVTEFPKLEDCFWDGERHKQCLNKGFKSGYTKMCPYLHLGANFSVANPQFFVGA